MTVNDLENKKILHLTHTDLDGLSAHVVSKVLLEPKNNITYDYVDYGHLQEVVSKYDSNLFDVLIITDLNLDKTASEYLVKKFRKVLVFDHHIWNADAIIDSDWVVDTTKCGALVYFDQFDTQDQNYSSKLLEKFLYYVNIFDLWKTNQYLDWLFGTVLANFVNEPLPFITKKRDLEFKTNVLYEILSYFIGHDVSSQSLLSAIYSEGSNILNVTKEEACVSDLLTQVALVEGKYLDKISDVFIDNENQVIVYVLKDIPKQLLSFGCITFFKENPNSVIIACDTKNDTIGIRSYNNGLALVYAQLFGGGGHPDAAGATIPYQGVIDMLEHKLEQLQVYTLNSRKFYEGPINPTENVVIVDKSSDGKYCLVARLRFFSLGDILQEKFDLEHDLARNALVWISCDKLKENKNFKNNL